MPHPQAIDRRIGLVVLVAILALAWAGSARGAVAPGGVGASGRIAVTDVVCVKQCVAVHKVRPGSTVRFRGSDLEEVSQVVFRGATGPLKVTPMRRTERVATAMVPDGAVAGRPYVIDQAGRRSAPAPHKLFILPRIAAPAPPATSTATAYPIAGPHNSGRASAGRATTAASTSAPPAGRRWSRLCRARSSTTNTNRGPAITW